MPVDQTWRTRTGPASWVCEGVSSKASTCARSMGPWRVGRSQGQHTSPPELGASEGWAREPACSQAQGLWIDQAKEDEGGKEHCR